MYVHPFWCGVIATFALEFILFMIYGLWKTNKKEKKDGEKEN